MSAPRATPATKPSTGIRPSRRGFLGGALAIGLAAALLPADRAMVRSKPWTSKDRWIGHW